MSQPHIVLLHPALSLRGTTERTLAIAEALRERARVSVATQSGSRRAAFERAGIDLLDLELPLNPLASPFATLRTRRVLKELEADVLHATHSSLDRLTARLALLLELPYLLEVGRSLRRRTVIAPERLQRVVLTCRTLTEAAINRGRLPREKVTLLEHGPRIPAAAPRAPFDHGGAARVGFTGHIERSRGSAVFLEAARILSASGRAISFLFLGEGPDEQFLRRKVRELGLTEQVTITAPSTPTTSELLVHLDLHVSCNLDGVPDWLAHQALGLGVPSIVSAVSSSFSMVEDGASGVLVERGDAQALAREIATLVDDPERALGLGREARRRMLASDPARAFENGLDRIYTDLVGIALV